VLIPNVKFAQNHNVSFVCQINICQESQSYVSLLVIVDFMVMILLDHAKNVIKHVRSVIILYLLNVQHVLIIHSCWFWILHL